MKSCPLEALRAARRLAAGSTACPSWRDRQHDLTDDDCGINHGCVLINPGVDGPVEAYLRCRESVSEPDVLGAVSVTIFTTDRNADAGAGWYLEIPVDEHLAGIQPAVSCAMMLVKTSAAAADRTTVNRELADTVLDLVDRATPAHVIAAI